MGGETLNKASLQVLTFGLYVSSLLRFVCLELQVFWVLFRTDFAFSVHVQVEIKTDILDQQ